MKAATGELSLTLVTVLAIGAILVLFSTLILPNIKKKIEDPTGDWKIDPSATSYIEVVDTNLM